MASFLSPWRLALLALCTSLRWPASLAAGGGDPCQQSPSADVTIYPAADVANVSLSLATKEGDITIEPDSNGVYNSVYLHAQHGGIVASYYVGSRLPATARVAIHTESRP